jgi:hypothetical protein
MGGFTVWQASARPWCRKAGGLDGISDAELDEVSRRGVDALWLMGVWTVGQASRSVALGHDGLRAEFGRALPDWQVEDVAGSPFSVAGYEVAQDLGGEEALRRFRARLDSRGLGLILDFVPNHTAVDHPWVLARRDLYVQGSAEAAAVAPHNFLGDPSGYIAHGRDPFFDGWTDTAQLDYRLGAVRKAQTSELGRIAEHCDGVRCDMAMLLLSDVFEKTWGSCPARGECASGEFWAGALDDVRGRHPGFRFIAEAYWGLEGRLVSLGFDYVYDKGLYDALRASDMGAVDRAVGWNEARLLTGMRFLENHDEPRAAASFPGHEAAAVAALTLPGGRLLHEGQDRGARTRLPVQLSRRPEEDEDPGVKKLYHALWPVIASDLLRLGRWERIQPLPVHPDDSSHANLLLWTWTGVGQRALLCAANIGAETSRCRARLTLLGFGGRRVVWRDALDGAQYVRNGSEMEDPGLFVELGPGRAHLLKTQA